MKKIICTAFFVFATTLCFSAQTGTADGVMKETIAVPTQMSDIPTPVPGCSHVPADCPVSKMAI